MSSRATHALVVAAVGLACAAAPVGCSEATDTNDVVPANAGAFQPKANGQRTNEADACSSVIAAEDARRSTLGCGSVQRPPCPEYIRPAGGSDCYEYDQGTVDACVAYYAGLSSCEAFNNPCVVTSYTTAACASGSGGSSGAGGSAGAAGAGGVAGSGGSAGTASSGGTGGTSGGAGGGGAGGGSGGTSGGAAGAAAGAAGSGTGGTT